MVRTPRCPGGRSGLLAALFLGAAACRSGYEPPDLHELYDRIAREHTPDRNPLIVIPGILGSSLKDTETGKAVWGAFGGDSADPESAAGARLVALPMAPGATLSELRDGVVEDGALETVRLRLFGLPIGVNAYFNILSALGVLGGYRDQQLGEAGAVDYGKDHFTCFQFAYDWRRDISETAAELHSFILEKEAYIRAEYRKRGIEKDEIRFDVVAHSMGGLVLRYYLRYGPHPLPEDGSLPEPTWEGARHVDRAVLIATPNAGSILSFVQLVEGFTPGLFLPHYSAAVLGTMPAIYQLLPRPRHGAWRTDDELDPLDPDVWQAFGWGLAAPGLDRDLARLLPEVATAEERRQVALDHLRKCLVRARQFFAAMDRPATPPPGTELYLTAGDAIRTPASVRIDASGALGELGTAPGDGTVLRSSALMDERLAGGWRPTLASPIRWARVMFFFESHLGLTKSPAFIDNVLYVLLEEPRTPGGPGGSAR